MEFVPVFSYPGEPERCVVRVRFSPSGSFRVAGVESTGKVRLMDLNSQRSLSVDFYDSKSLSGFAFDAYLCDFSFNETGDCIYVASSDGNVSLAAVNMLGQHLPNKSHHLQKIAFSHTGGTLCVSPSPVYDFVIYTGGGDGFVRQWDLRLISSRNCYNRADYYENCKEGPTRRREGWVKPLVSLWAHNVAVSGISFGGRNSMFTCGVDESVRIWNCDYFSATETINGTGDGLGVWDLTIDRESDTAVVIGRLGSPWTFPLEFCGKGPNFRSRGIRKLHIDDSPPKDPDSLFCHWRRICAFDNIAIIPTLGKFDSAKAFLLDIETCKILGTLVYKGDFDANGRISSVDVHPDPQIRLIISGAGTSGTCTIWCN